MVVADANAGLSVMPPEKTSKASVPSAGSLEGRVMVTEYVIVVPNCGVTTTVNVLAPMFTVRPAEVAADAIATEPGV
jgi:hypothetical protein